MFNWKRKMLKAQGDLQHEMRKYERDGLVDVSKMESELGKLDAQLQHLSTSVPADQLIELIQRRSRVERLNMKRTMRHEGHLLHKAHHAPRQPRGIRAPNRAGCGQSAGHPCGVGKGGPGDEKLS
ncbi:Hypothetical protein SCF082_LOCUS20216 [Durusdinium trenchii]|uniref:Uncharacterized protein n=1 Tax=Durusdinium trenchii TaxID=1381693 RepID=A0ABP0L0W0_9DINO